MAVLLQAIRRLERMVDRARARAGNGHEPDPPAPGDGDPQDGSPRQEPGPGA
jgi:hypothetical protein